MALFGLRNKKSFETDYGKENLKENEVIVVIEDGQIMDIKAHHKVKLHIILLKSDFLNPRYICHCKIHNTPHAHRKSFHDPNFWVNGKEVHTFDSQYLMKRR